MPTTTTAAHRPPRRSPHSVPRRSCTGLIGQLNAEWSALCADESTTATVTSWAMGHGSLAGCARLADVERAVAAGGPDDRDRILLALLREAHDGDELAGRTVLQLMLGKAVRIAARHCGRDSRESLEHAAVGALWTTIATYPIVRRPARVAANIAMDTLRAVCGELAHDRTEAPTEPDALARATRAEPAASPADLELVELLAWAVDAALVTAADATLIVDIYAPAAGESGGAAAAERHGLSWPAARQRASRAVRKITQAVREDLPATA